MITYEQYQGILSDVELNIFFYFDEKNRLVRSSFDKEKRFDHVLYQPKSKFLEEFKLFLCGQKPFDLSLLNIQGTPFQKAVWRELLCIPRGKTSSYGEVAKKIQSPQSYRAVGNAVGKNPFAVIIPCHRVLHSGKKQVGKFGGRELIKKALLENEGVFLLK